MKLGIVLLVVGVALLFLAIPYSIVSIFIGVTKMEEGIISGGFQAYPGVIGVIAGFVLTTVGAIRVFKRWREVTMVSRTGIEPVTC
jgi:uncharacterized membrane protein